MLINSYSPKIYDSLGDIDVVSKEVRESDIDGLGKIVLRYGYQKSVLIIIAHRHFNLEQEEAMFEETVGLSRFSKPYLLKKIEDKGATPNLLKCTLHGKWFPVGFDLPTGQEVPWKNANFLKEVGNYLIKNNLVDKLMLGSKSAGEEELYGAKWCEFNYGETRTSETRIGTEEELASAIPTTYSVNSNGDIEVAARCTPYGEIH